MTEINDLYKEPKSFSESLFKDKGSKHFGYVFRVQNKEEISLRLIELKKKHHASRHICYAWTLGIENPETKFTDDGEPHNSAGPPIMGQINSFGLHNTLIAVVRYFGGTKLGVGGLINAYKTAAKEAIENGEIVDKYQQQELQIVFPYDLMNDVMRIVKQEGITITKQDFTDQCVMEIKIRLKFYSTTKQKLTKLHRLNIQET